jgi:hypothetical protein
MCFERGGIVPFESKYTNLALNLIIVFLRKIKKNRFSDAAVKDLSIEDLTGSGVIRQLFIELKGKDAEIFSKIRPSSVLREPIKVRQQP